MLEYQEAARVFKAFCDENRLMILELLKNGGRYSCDMIDDLHIAQSTLSHHMRVLCESGIVHSRRMGKWIYYSISPEGLAHAKQLLNQLTQPTT